MNYKPSTAIKLCITIPCYNEEKGLKTAKYSTFLNANSSVFICFINDGSTDNTAKILETLKAKHPQQIHIYTCKKNVGKAAAIRNGVGYCNQHYTFTYLAYLDADLATSLEECYELTQYLNNDIHFVFGSRIKKIGSTIERKSFRFFTGRVIATAISNILKLSVYDTQCGCKIFTKELSQQVFKDPFISKWLFDVEIFNRIIAYYGREKVLTKMLEVPLKKWIDQGDSKVKMSYFFKLWIDLYRINKICKV